MRRCVTPVVVTVVGVLGCVTITASAQGGDFDADRSRRAIVQHLAHDRHNEALGALKSYLSDQPDDGAMLYNAACVSAQLQQLDEAETYLRRAIKAGFLRFSHMQRDPDLAPLRDRPVYRAIMQARRAADGVYRQRRIASWRTQLDEGYVLMKHVTPGADVLTAMRETRRRALADRMQRLVDHAVYSLFDQSFDHAVLVVHVTRADAEQFLSNEHIHGMYRHEARELITLDAGRSLQHELVHALHHAHMDRVHQQHPIWIVEGLASLYEAFEPHASNGARFLSNDRTALMRRLARNSERIRLSELLTFSEPEFLSEPAPHYAHVRSLFRFLADNDALTNWYDAYVRSYDDDPSGALALRRTFNQSIAEIDDRWHEWIESGDEARTSQSAERAIVVASRESTRPSRAPQSHGNANSSAHGHDPALMKFKQLKNQSSHGDYATMIEPLREIVAMKPTFSDARYKLGLACAATGDRDGARAQYRALRDLDASLANLLKNLLDHEAALK